MKRTTTQKKKVEYEDKRIEHEEREKGKSGARAELEPRFILDLGSCFF